MLQQRTAWGLMLLGAFLAVAESAPVPWPWEKYGLPRSDNPCCIPVPYEASDWRLQQFNATVKTDFSGWGKNVVFLGDSITHGWHWLPQYPNGNGASVLKEYEPKFPNVRPYSLGMSSDEPQNTLWQLTEGDLLRSFRNPKAIVLMIGINSLNRKKTAEQVAEGVKTIVAYLRTIRPESKILVLGVLPCWGEKAPVREQIAKTNDIIRTRADRKEVFYLEFGNRLLNAAGDLDSSLSYDAIHLTTKGYGVWAEFMFPYLDDLVTTGGKGIIWQTDVSGGRPTR